MRTLWLVVGSWWLVRQDTVPSTLSDQSPANTIYQPPTTNHQPLRAIIAALAIALLLPAVASACPVCYGDPNSPMVKGANNGVAVLLGIVAFVQVGFVALFLSFWKRAQGLRRKRDQFRIIEGGAR